MPILRVADRPTIPQRSSHLAPRAANAPKVVSEERALALGLPGTSNGTRTGIECGNRDFAGGNAAGLRRAPDEAANLAARPADTVIETLLAAAHIGLALVDRDMNYRLWNNCLEELFDVPADALLGGAVDQAGRAESAIGPDYGAEAHQRKR
jgi:hypothetical protein